DGRVCAARAVVVGGSAAADAPAGITTLTLLSWIVFAVAAWEGRGDGAVLGPRGRGLLRTDGEDGATGGTGKAALGAPEMRAYLAGQLVGQRGPGTHPAVELGRHPQYHLRGYTQLAGQPVHIDHVCCSFSKRCRLNRYCMPKHAAPRGRSDRRAPCHSSPSHAAGIPYLDGCSAASAGRQGQLYADARLDRTAMSSGLQSLTDPPRSPPSLAGDLELDRIRGRRPAYGRGH